MKNANSIKTSYKVKNVIGSFFAVHKVTFIISVLFVILGAVCGIFTVVKYSGNIQIDNIFDNNILQMIKGNRNVFGLFFSYLFIYIIICAIIIFLNFKPWMMCFTFFALFFLGYVAGYNGTIIIILFGFVGVINTILVIVPLEILTILVIILIASIALKRNLIIKKFGCTYYNNNTKFNLQKVYLSLFLLGVVMFFLKSLLLPVIRITIIVN